MINIIEIKKIADEKHFIVINTTDYNDDNKACIQSFSDCDSWREAESLGFANEDLIELDRLNVNEIYVAPMFYGCYVMRVA